MNGRVRDAALVPFSKWKAHLALHQGKEVRVHELGHHARLEVGEADAKARLTPKRDGGWPNEVHADQTARIRKVEQVLGVEV